MDCSEKILCYSGNKSQLPVEYGDLLGCNSFSLLSPPANEVARRYCFQSYLSVSGGTLMGSLPGPVQIFFTWTSLHSLWLGTPSSKKSACWKMGGWHSAEMPSCLGNKFSFKSMEITRKNALNKHIKYVDYNGLGMCWRKRFYFVRQSVLQILQTTNIHWCLLSSYQPQGKVMFSEASVSHSVQGGCVCLEGRGCLPTGRRVVYRGSTYRGLYQGDVCLRGDSAYRGGSASRGWSAQHPHVLTSTGGHCSGWYASYQNTFLFVNVSLFFDKIVKFVDLLWSQCQFKTLLQATFFLRTKVDGKLVQTHASFCVRKSLCSST